MGKMEESEKKKQIILALGQNFTIYERGGGAYKLNIQSLYLQ